MRKPKSRYRLYPNAVPSFWAKPLIAAQWLTATGWELREDDRAYKPGRRDIPAPVAPALYDLHDVACAEGWGAGETAQRILRWASEAGHDVAGIVGFPQHSPEPISSTAS